MSGDHDERERRQRSMPHYLASSDPNGAPKEPLGVLLLHGFTSSLDTVRPLVPMLERNQLPFRMPVLRGHNSKPEDLQDVTWQDWLADGESALRDLLNEAERVAILGLSMGGLVALDLSIKYSGRLAGVCVLVPALKMKSPLTPLAGILSRLIPYFPAPAAISDPKLAERNTNYKRFPTKALLQLIAYQKVITVKLPQVRVPLLVVGVEHDKVITPASSKQIYDAVSTPEGKKELVWVERGNHELLMDVEREAVVEKVEDWVLGL